METDKVFAVVGLGTFGRQVADELYRKGGKVVAIDNQPELVERVKSSVTQAVLVNATDAEALAQAPLDDVDVAVVAIGDNIEASILATALLKKMRVPFVIARAVSDLHQLVLKQVGADQVVNIEIEEGTRLAMRLIAPHVLDRVPLSKSDSVAELRVPRAVLGSTLAELKLRARFRVNVVSIRRTHVDVDELGNPERREELIFPGPTDELKEDDVIMVVGRNEDIDAFSAL